MVLGMIWYGRYGMALLQLEGTCMLQSVVGSWLPFEKFLVVPVCCVGVEGTVTSPLEAESDLPRLRRASLSSWRLGYGRYAMELNCFSILHA